jgi:hypothetical protein
VKPLGLFGLPARSNAQADPMPRAGRAALIHGISGHLQQAQRHFPLVLMLR